MLKLAGYICSTTVKQHSRTTQISQPKCFSQMSHLNFFPRYWVMGNEHALVKAIQVAQSHYMEGGEPWLMTQTRLRAYGTMSTFNGQGTNVFSSQTTFHLNSKLTNPLMEQVNLWTLWPISCLRGWRVVYTHAVELQIQCAGHKIP